MFETISLTEVTLETATVIFEWTVHLSYCALMISSPVCQQKRQYTGKPALNNCLVISLIWKRSDLYRRLPIWRNLRRAYIWWWQPSIAWEKFRFENTISGYSTAKGRYSTMRIILHRSARVLSESRHIVDKAIKLASFTRSNIRVDNRSSDVGQLYDAAQKSLYVSCLYGYVQ